MEKLLRKVLSLSKLKPHYVNVLISRIDEYDTVFKTKSYNSTDNYELYEFLGDGIINAFICWYFYRRFPQLRCSDGVKKLARLKINYASRKSFAGIAEKLGFFPLIKCTDDEREKRKEEILEDVFEAFIGLTIRILDEEFEIGVGYGIVYEMLKTIFDEMEVSLEYEDLYDAKSRLKELFDSIPSLGIIRYEHISPTEVKVYRIFNEQKIYLGEGKGRTKSDREKEAAEKALETLRKEGHVRKKISDLLCENV